ncbi:MAG: integrase arm-type DNA-binding domain-containing protein [Gammaproteobacteria bacterium]|nr:integrase arm-type DNA-binding domain-containing protein [Gammaproteobacteria bacterium]MBL6999228.1 integrase arm-type DNA-binding domain-containing protein [Gammaproteobacteria bacterium]
MTADIVKLSTHRRKQTNTKPLTALRVKNHKSGILSEAHPYKGLRLRANKNGTKTWMYRYRSGGNLKQIKLGTYPGMELSEARRALIEQRKFKELHQDPRRVALQKKKDAEELDALERKQVFTFAVMVEQYLSERIEKDRKTKGAKEVRRLLENDLGDLADFSVNEIEPENLHEHILKIAVRAPDVARVFRSELSRAWRYAINVGRTKIACLINTDTGGKLTQGKRERFLDEGELKLLLPWMPNYSRTVEEILILTLYLGLRSGEVCKLRDEWLKEESDGWWLTIPASEMKRNHSDHHIPLVGTALKIAKSRSGYGIWFPSRAGGPVQQKILGVEVYAHSGRSKAKTYQHLRICPVTNWAPNDLRKTARSHLAALGCPFEVAESVLHHRIPGVGGLYNRHRYNAEKREWLMKLGEFFDRLGVDE